MRLTASIVSGVTWSVSPFMIHSKPSRMPTTSTSSRRARIVAAPMTLLMPGAGPPPTRMASLLGELMRKSEMLNVERIIGVVSFNSTHYRLPIKLPIPHFTFHISRCGSLDLFQIDVPELDFHRLAHVHLEADQALRHPV